MGNHIVQLTRDTTPLLLYMLMRQQRALSFGALCTLDQFGGSFSTATHVVTQQHCRADARDDL